MVNTKARNLVTLGNAVELITSIALEVLGKEITNTVNGEKITPESARLLAASALTRNLSEKKHA